MRTYQNLMPWFVAPQPRFSQSQVEARRWSREYRDRLIREEVTALEQIRDLRSLV